MRGLLGEIVSTEREITVVDMEAGLEHLSRSGGTLRHVDHLLVMVEPYAKAIETARRTIRLARELGITRVSLVANKIRDAGDLRLVESVCAEFKLELTGIIPYDEAAWLADRVGAPVIDAAPESALVTAVGQLAGVMCAPQPV